MENLLGNFKDHYKGEPLTNNQTRFVIFALNNPDMFSMIGKFSHLLAPIKSTINSPDFVSDPHTRSAMAKLGISKEEVTKQIRNKEKLLNFGILYGSTIDSFNLSGKFKKSKL